MLNSRPEFQHADVKILDSRGSTILPLVWVENLLFLWNDYHKGWLCEIWNFDVLRFLRQNQDWRILLHDATCNSSKNIQGVRLNVSQMSTTTMPPLYVRFSWNLQEMFLIRWRVVSQVFSVVLLIEIFLQPLQFQRWIFMSTFFMAHIQWKNCFQTEIRIPYSLVKWNLTVIVQFCTR